MFLSLFLGHRCTTGLQSVLETLGTDSKDLNLKLVYIKLGFGHMLTSMNQTSRLNDQTTASHSGTVRFH